MERKYTVLIVDDSEKNIEMISEMLSDSYELITAANGIDALEVMRGERCPDVVLLDVLMSKSDGYDILRIISEDETLRFIPVIAITFDSDPDARERVFELGAVDFLSCSEDIGIIQYRVRSVLRLCEMNKMRCEKERRLSAIMYGDGNPKTCTFVTDVTKEKHYEDELYFDSLTGLYNRHAFIKNARRVMDEDPLTQFSIMMLNIGSFKVVNDLFGRDVGDKVLTVIANAVRGLVADKGIYARFFSDNFVVLSPCSESGVQPQTMLDAVRKAVAQSGLLSHEIQYYIGVYTVADRSMS
ncbi:MAG: diguanylate cyclase, partial [Oscillospiraceae bacterium]|nr:diguanylate cyclase [Oscillospiraceae bacterium]